MAKQSKARAKLLAEMATGIGASECHHLFSLPPFGCRRQLWYSKRKVKADFPVTETKDMARGTALEPIIRKLYAAKHGRVYKPEMYRKGSNLICHPDGIITAIKDGPDHYSVPAESDGLLEIKCPGTRNFLRVKQNGLGDAWLLQAQQGMYVTDSRWCHFVVFNADEWDFLLVPLREDKDIHESIQANATEFEYQVTGTQPEPTRLLPDDPRCQRCPWRTQCQGKHLLATVAPDEDRQALTVLPRDEALAPVIQEYIEAAALEKEAGSLKDKAEKELKAQLGDRPGVMTEIGRAYFRPYERHTIDSKALRAERPEIAEEYTRTSVVRPLKVYPNGERS